jgi:hypothetical protein
MAMRTIRTCCLAIVLALAAGPASAEFFFMVIDTMVVTECAETADKGPQTIKTRLESNPGVECELDTTHGSYSTISCTSLQVTTTYLTDSEEACESLLSTMKSRLEQ